jgi:hypothetical protein
VSPTNDCRFPGVTTTGINVAAGRARRSRSTTGRPTPVASTARCRVPAASARACVPSGIRSSIRSRSSVGFWYANTAASQRVANFAVNENVDFRAVCAGASAGRAFSVKVRPEQPHFRVARIPGVIRKLRPGIGKYFLPTHDLSGLQNAVPSGSRQARSDPDITLGSARMAGDRLNREFCDSGNAAHRLSLQKRIGASYLVPCIQTKG